MVESMSPPSNVLGYTHKYDVSSGIVWASGLRVNYQMEKRDDVPPRRPHKYALALEFQSNTCKRSNAAVIRHALGASKIKPHTLARYVRKYFRTFVLYESIDTVSIFEGRIVVRKYGRKYTP